MWTAVENCRLGLVLSCVREALAQIVRGMVRTLNNKWFPDAHNDPERSNWLI